MELCNFIEIPNRFQSWSLFPIRMLNEGLCTKTGPLNCISYHLTKGSKYLFLQNLWQVYQNQSEFHLTIFCIDLNDLFLLFITSMSQQNLRAVFAWIIFSEEIVEKPSRIFFTDLCSQIYWLQNVTLPAPLEPHAPNLMIYCEHCSVSGCPHALGWKLCQNQCEKISGWFFYNILRNLSISKIKQIYELPRKV